MAAKAQIVMVLMEIVFSRNISRTNGTYIEEAINSSVTEIIKVIRLFGIYFC
jgi:hypothetical protein